ncbi:MAG: hypothetical protein FJ276_15645 [Planctomycetes bacterium]|nr:hypothetical protein [Planctomycetota bacterium]
MDTEQEPVPARSIPKWLAIALQTIILVGLGFSVYEQQWLNTVVIVSILLLTILPALLSRRLAIFIPPEFELATIAFIFAALFLGETRNYYDRYWWWDIALHATSGGLLGILGLLLVYILNETPRVDLHMRPGFVAFFAFCFSVTVGALWEIFEFAMDGFIGTNMQKPMFDDPSGLTDTMWDLIVDTLGALVVATLGYVYMKRGSKSVIARWIQRFIDGNPRLFSRQ